MSSRGTVSLDNLWEMLSLCAPGFTKHSGRRNEYWCVNYGDKTFPRLPMGRHGKRHAAEVQIGHVRHMLRHLVVDMDCAKRHLEILR